MISNSGTSTLGLYDLKRQIDAFGGVDYFRPNLVGGYLKNARVMLANGDIVKSTIDGNVNDPNVDMTGWVKTNSASQIFDASGLSQQQINSWLPLPTIDGAKGDGVNDDTDALQAYINKYRYVNLRGKDWKISRKLTIPSYRVVDLSGSNLTANNGTDPIFEMQQAGEGLSIIQGGGIISGTADSFLMCTGSTATPTSISHYARQIRLDGLHIVSPTIDKFLDFKDAVRQVFIDKVHAYTKNGISAVGKCVEVKVTKSIIYGATGEAGTYGLKLNSPAGTSFYNEGFHFTDCTIDNFNTTFDVTDIYALSVTGGHIGRSQISGSVVAKFGQPTSTHCKDIKFTGVNINGSVVFNPTSGCDYYAQFTGCVSESATAANINIRSFSANIKIADHTFHTSNSGVAVVCANGTNDISVNNISCDTTFIGGVQVLGSAGTDILIDGIQYSGTGNAIYLERPVRLANVPISDATKDYIQKFNTGSIQGSHIVGANIASVNNWFAKGETGVIVCEFTYTGASASQVLTITTPTGMSIPSGTGWSSGAVMLNTVDGRVSLAIPYIVTQDISSGAIVLKNDIGNTISLGYHSYFGFKRD